MRHKRVYNPAPQAEEKLPACVKCGSTNIKTLDNWLTHPCVRVVICRDCGRMTDGTGPDIAACKASALKNWQDPACDLPPWWDEEDSLAAVLAALALLGLGVLGLLALIDRVGVWLDEHPEEGRKHEK